MCFLSVFRSIANITMMFAGKGCGYVTWVKKNFNVKQRTEPMLFMREHKLESFDELVRRAKSHAIGRKAFLFHASAAGAGASAIAVMYSIIETAKSNKSN